MSTSHRQGWCVIPLLCLLASGAALAKDKSGRLDKGLLDPDWFGPNIQFLTTEEIDYLWVKPGFSIKGRKILIQSWLDPVLLDEDRDAKDSAKASELTELMPSRIRGALAAALSGVAQVSREEGDTVLTGRIVDCNAGSKAAKFLVGMGAGSATATWDIKITDKESGQLLAAIHHRSISGSSMSEIDDKVAKWLEEFGQALHGDLAVAASGKPAKK